MAQRIDIQPNLQQKYPLLKRGSFSKEEKPKVKIEAPLHDLADLIHGAITGNHEEPVQLAENQNETGNNIQEPQPKLEMQQASIGDQLDQPQLNTTALQDNYEPTNLSSGMQSGGQPNPQMQASVFDRLKDSLNSIPKQTDYHPSTIRKIAGGVVGGLTGAAFGPEQGKKSAEDIVQAPYRESYQDWLNKSGALEKEADVELKRGKASQEDTQNYLNYLKVKHDIDETDLQNDPEHQRVLAKGKKTGEEEALKPGREDADARELNNKIVLESIQTQREKDLEEIRQRGRKELSAEERKQKDKEITSREKLANQAINSKENISRLNREMREKIISSKNQRVSPNQQAYAQMLAENDVSKTIASFDDLELFFIEQKDKDGNVTSYKLKPISSFKNPRDKTRYDAIKSQIDNLKKGILKNSYNPSSDEPDVENDDDTDDISVEEIN